MEMNCRVKILFLESENNNFKSAIEAIRKSDLPHCIEKISLKQFDLNNLITLEPHVIISEYHAAKSQNYDILRLVQNYPAFITFIFLAEEMNLNDAENCIRMGAADFITYNQIERLPFAIQKDRVWNSSEFENLAVSKTDKKYFSHHFDLFCVADLNGNFLRVNKAWQKTLGYKQEDLENHSFLELVHPDDLQATKREITNLENGKESINFTNRYKALDGNYRWIEWYSKPSGAEIFAAARDITEQVMAEHTLKESEKNYRLLAEHTLDIIWHMDLNLNFNYINPAVYRILGYQPDEIIGHNLAEFLDPQDINRIKNLIYKKMDGNDLEKGAELELKINSKNGKKVPVEINGRILVNENNQPIGLQGTARDMTEREKMLSNQYHIAKMEAIGTMAGGIAHDFNNMLAAILGYAEMSLDDVPEDSVVHQNLKMIQQAGVKAKELVKQILTFSRQSEGVIKPVNIAVILKEVIRLLQFTLPAMVRIKTEIDDNCGLVQADAVQLHQCIMNICTNAYQAIGDKSGRIEIYLSPVNQGEFPSRLLSKSGNGNYVRLRIKDNGTGMDRKTLNRIFDPFFTTKEVGKGTGLGLSVVHGIIKSINGIIDVSSAPGQGTVFDIYLPIIKHTETKNAPDVRCPDSDSPHNILLVDDEETVLKMMKQLLEKFNYRVSAEVNSPAALELFSKSPQEYDLIIVDQQMPEMTGEKFSQEVLIIRPDMPIILITGNTGSITPLIAADMGLSGYCYKPLDMKHLLNEIQQVLKKKEEILS